MVTAAAPDIPPPLAEQLANGGRLIIPVGTAEEQRLLRVEKRDHALSTRPLYHCRFVPLLGRYGWQADMD